MKISKTQQRLLGILKNRQTSYTLEDLANSLDLSSISTVHYNIHELIKKGYIKQNPSNTSDYIVLDKLDQGLFYLPLFEGAAKCGPDGNMLEEYMSEEIPVPSKLFSFDVSKALAVKTFNDSMEPEIPRNSVVLINKDESEYQPNKTFLISYKEEALIKNLNFDKDNENYILSSFNKNYRPFIALPVDVHIIGRVKAVISNKDI